MVGWLCRLNGSESEHTLGDSEGQGSLECCSPWGLKESDTTQQLNNKWEYINTKKELRMLQETDVKEIKKTKKKIFSCIFQINLKMSGTDNFLRK